MDLTPMRRAEAVLLKSNPRGRETGFGNQFRNPAVERAFIGLVDFYPFDPGLPARKLFGKSIENDDRIPFPRPQHHETTHRAGNVQMPRESARHRHSRQVSEVDARTNRDSGQSVSVHAGVEPIDVGCHSATVLRHHVILTKLVDASAHVPDFECYDALIGPVRAVFHAWRTAGIHSLLEELIAIPLAAFQDINFLPEIVNEG